MSPDSPPSITCNYPNCQAPEVGVCALGHSSTDDCPEAKAVEQEPVLGDPAEQEDTLAEEQPVPPPPPGIELRSGRALTIEQGNALASRKGARIVLPAGPSDAGKTTFLIELYARFLEGRSFQSAFLESETLLEFDYLLFPSRLVEEKQVAATWRTHLEDAHQALLHLGVDSEQYGKQHLLLSNITGELFERICDHGEALKEVPLLGVADRLLVFIDGNKLRAGGTRGSAISRTRQFINVLAEEEVLPTSAEVALVVSKLDLLKEQGDEALEAWSTHESRLLEEMSQLNRPLKVFQIAARPMAGPVDDGDLGDLFNWLLAPSSQASLSLGDESSPSRAYERFRS